MVNTVPLFIDGEFKTSTSTSVLPVINPANQQTLAEVPLATGSEIEAAIAGAQQAFLTWREVALPERARLMMRYANLLKQHHDELGELLSQDTGKTFEDAKGDVWRGIEVVEQAANIPALMMGETAENVASGVDIYSYLQPLGVCVGITPFNFPAMIPLWMFPLSIACGNTFILKPSEQVPLVPVRLLELFVEAGVPKGVIQLIHGGEQQVNELIDHPATKAVSFVGSIGVGESVYRRATNRLKRAQCFAGAKNHSVVMPDADKQTVINQLVGASVGAAGQRCMAISVVVFVGDSKNYLGEFAEALANVLPGAWNDPKAGFGPLVSKSAKQRVLDLIAQGKKEGAKCLLDGSDYQVKGFEDGNWIGPTLFSEVSADMQIYQQEIFGPVLCCMQVESLDEAIALINANPCGNGTSIFTNSGPAARYFQHNIEVGQVGINIPIPVPLPFFSFTGWKASFMGDLHAYGKQAVRFYTETKTITARWPYNQTTHNQQPNTTIHLK